MWSARSAASPPASCSTRCCCRRSASPRSSLLSVGYLAGRYREGVEVTNWLIPPLLAGGFTLLGAAGFAAVQLMLGIDATVSVLFVREIVVQGLLAVLLAIAVYPLVRRILAPALID